MHHHPQSVERPQHRRHNVVAVARAHIHVRKCMLKFDCTYALGACVCSGRQHWGAEVDDEEVDGCGVVVDDHEGRDHDRDDDYDNEEFFLK